MKDCVFCTIVNKTDMTYNSKWVKTDLYEDDSVVIRPARGMSAENYLMVISKKHYNGFAEYSDAELLKLEKLINKICEAYFNHIGVYPIIFEHGSLAEGRHSLSITHAHMHIIPMSLTTTSKEALFSSLHLRRVKNILDLKSLKNKDYWVYRSEKREYFASHSVVNAPRSCFIKIVASQAGRGSDYEWRDEKNNRSDFVETTIDTFLKLGIKVEH
jgi:diadenosine tetraphosphate (Ap4A) HIT family hydrolase